MKSKRKNILCSYISEKAVKEDISNLIPSLEEEVSEVLGHVVNITSPNDLETLIKISTILKTSKEVNIINCSIILDDLIDSIINRYKDDKNND